MPVVTSAESGDFAAAEYAAESAGLDLSPASIQSWVTEATSDALVAGGSVVGLEEEAASCANFATTAGAVSGTIAATVGAIFLGPVGALALGALGAASGAAQFGAACTAVKATKKKKIPPEEQGVFQSETGANTWPLPAVVWDDVIAPLIDPKINATPKVGPGSIRPDIAVAMPVELERLQARQAEREAAATSGSVLAAGAVAAVLAYKLL